MRSGLPVSRIEISHVNRPTVSSQHSATTSLNNVNIIRESILVKGLVYTLTSLSKYP